MQATLATGSSMARAFSRHVLPNIAAPVIILFSINIGAVMEQAPWLARWPGLCLTLTVYSLNIFGDALRDLLDPRLRGGGGRLAAAKTRKASSSAGHR